MHAHMYAAGPMHQHLRTDVITCTELGSHLTTELGRATSLQLAASPKACAHLNFVKLLEVHCGPSAVGDVNEVGLAPFERIVECRRKQSVTHVAALSCTYPAFA